MKHLLSIYAVLLLHTVTLVALSTEQNICIGQPQIVAWNGQQGGLYLPSQGLVHGLVIFAQFPDDSLDINHPEWQKNQPPRQMGEWVDSIWTGNPTPYSMTDYFNQMSFGRFKFTAKKRFVIAPRTREQYRALGLSRADIHREIIQILDSTMDFSEFDRWDPEAPYIQIERQDKIVDLVMVVWRNVIDDLPTDSLKTLFRDKLDFRYDQSDLGSTGLIPVDVGAGNYWVPTGWGMNGNTPNGVAITMRKTFTRTPFMSEMQTCIHEVAHNLIAGNQCHIGFGHWGMVSAYGIRNFTANSFERNRLGWISLVTMDSSSSPVTGATLPDYVTTGIAYRYIIDSVSGQFFYIENHQGISRWDKTNSGAEMEHGVFVLRQDSTWGLITGDYSQMRMIPADGRYTWRANRKEVHSCCGTKQLPVFQQLVPDRHNGEHDCDFVDFLYTPTGQIQNDHIILMEDNGGNTIHVARFSGDGQDAFRMGYQQVFSPWSNPTSQDKYRNNTGFGFEITGVTHTQNGDVYTLDFYPKQAVGASPAKIQDFKATPLQQDGHPLLTWQANEEPDLKWYKIYRTGVVNLLNGVPSDNAFQLIATLNAHNNGTPVTSWIDTASITSNTPNTDGYYYKITAIDSTNKESVRALSRVYVNSTISLPPGGGAKRSIEPQTESVQLFIAPNPSTDICSFTILLPKTEHIWLQLTDVTGKIIGTVVDSIIEAGEQQFQFDVSTFPQGMYFYQLITTSGRLSGILQVR